MHMLAANGKLHVHRQEREAVCACAYWYGKLHVHMQIKEAVCPCKGKLHAHGQVRDVIHVHACWLW